jgi:toxin ParE1/3/4
VKVHWTNTAAAHLLAIYEHIARDSPRYAARVVDRITRRSEQIGRFPDSGRAVAELGSPDVREVIETPYRVIYRVRPDRIDVIAVIHAARLIHRELDPPPPESR